MSTASALLPMPPERQAAPWLLTRAELAKLFRCCPNTVTSYGIPTHSELAQAHPGRVDAAIACLLGHESAHDVGTVKAAR